MLNGNWLLTRTSPAHVVPGASLGTTVWARLELAVSGRAATRMSPNRKSLWVRPAVPSDWPPSPTTPTLMLAYCAQAWNARRISAFHAASGYCASDEDNVLGVPLATV